MAGAAAEIEPVRGPVGGRARTSPGYAVRMAGYTDRREAGRILGDLVAEVIAGAPGSRRGARPRHAVGDEGPVTVLGLPRGGVPVAAEVARRLGATLDAIGVRKLGAPGQPEFALGAIATGGVRVLNTRAVERLGLAAEAIEAVAAREATELARRERVYREGRAPPPLAGRTVVLVDDGLATGATMVVAARAVRRAGPRRVIAALPVASPDGALAVRAEVDELVCPLMPPDFMAVGNYYRDFAPPTDDEVHALLRVAPPVR
ncbi:phosphoribosyltransferase [Pseudofrankia inefficax]|uniref:Phosphoribosyltransferase n=2 Tax=Pseudofrankia inefficax (strain DSM 45817 / CECT 9037 / DDB 130130 / EuI1c) TaxID=298654 RepID=E3JCG0_PSEI1|nr:phosphoribosyltransferase [Pseudofrankia inefficax]